jgi:hypothetical protein
MAPWSNTFIDLTGKRFGLLVAIEYLGRARWRCRCDCGQETRSNGAHLRHGFSRSCGCTRAKAAGQAAARACTTHGASKTPEFSIWTDMLRRCSDPRRPEFKHYGGRGITVCDRWRESFANFLADMGPRPSPGLTLDRRDNDGNYEPGNCRWATVLEQNRNRRWCKPK